MYQHIHRSGFIDLVSNILGECDTTCDVQLGCWGAGDDQCQACAGVRFNGRCLNAIACPLAQHEPRLYPDTSHRAYPSRDTECGLCDEQCEDICLGPVSMENPCCKLISLYGSCLQFFIVVHKLQCEAYDASYISTTGSM